MGHQILHKGWLVLVGGLLAAGCAGPQQNAMLQEAQAAYSAARSDPQVVSNAPAEMNRAAETLQRAETLYQEDAQEEAVTHQAYLARQKVAIAREAAQLKTAQATIANAEALRQEVLLSARSREAEQARQMAESRQKQLEEAQLMGREQARQAELARQQAEQAQEQSRRQAMQRTDELEQLRQELAGLQAQTQQTPRGIVLTLQDIVFEFNKAELNPGSERTIAKIAEFLRQHPDRTIAVEGFTDAVGPEEYNEKLSMERAEAVRQALVQQGIEPQRIITRGYGEQYPVATNDTPAGRQLNRRVEIIISNGAEQVSMQ